MYDRPQFYLTFGGSQANGSESWQTGLRFVGDIGHTLADYVSAQGSINVNDIATAFRDVIASNTMGTRYATATTYEWTKLAVLDTAGHYASDPKMSSLVGSGMVAAANIPPLQLAITISLWSGEKIGTANHGRMYWPCPSDFQGAVSPTNGLVADTNVVAFRGLVRDAINAAAGEVSTFPLPAYPAIMSQKGSGTTKVLAQIGCGHVIDTQRRRRGSLDENTAYVSRA